MNGETNEILLRIEDLARALLRASLANKISEIRADKTLRKIYELTSGSDVKRIARAAGVSTGKVSGIWQGWEDEGLVTRVGKSYRRMVD
jgi:hypothetical protein